ncbi:hypothetical protein BJP36_23500 [Moorena producens JHB]|uniref:Beta/gamma crystallin 'Greek key' domain-containing protein n=1 Tax=Moorena producens (strain JHB) TaxID=1454205 RepID=A0A1D9G458_MOOP1|nr:hypothetical protein [Moorena producens]AOY82432.1 hypothetical protein BJP36_23500 [Moorena producens JHB]
MSNIDNQFQNLDDIPALKELSDETAAACSGGVRLVAFDKPGFSGFKKRFGQRNGNSLDIRSVGGSINNKISSLKVFGGNSSLYKVTLFDGRNFQGKRESFTVPQGQGLSSLGNFINNKTSSIKVRPL